MFLTRIGYHSRAVITGDITQIDLPRNQISGLREAIEVLSRCRGYRLRHFRRTRRGAPPAGAEDRRRLRPLRPPGEACSRERASGVRGREAQIVALAGPGRFPRCARPPASRPGWRSWSTALAPEARALGVRFVGDRTMRAPQPRLPRQGQDDRRALLSRGARRPTAEHLGDVVISVPPADRQAAEARASGGARAARPPPARRAALPRPRSRDRRRRDGAARAPPAPALDRMPREAAH